MARKCHEQTAKISASARAAVRTSSRSAHYAWTQAKHCTKRTQYVRFPTSESECLNRGEHRDHEAIAMHPALHPALR